MKEEADRLNRLYDAYAEKGFKLLVISPHKVADLRKELIQENNAQYWIGSDSRGRTLIQFVVPNVVAEFPMTYLIDQHGKIVDYGDKLEAKIESLLEEVFDPALERDVHPGLKSARAKYEQGQIGAAWTFAGRKLEDEDSALVSDATYLRERCEAYAAWKQRMTQRDVDAGKYPTVVPELKGIEKAFKGMPIAAWAKETRRGLEKDPKVKVEIKAWAQLEKALTKAKKAKGDYKKMRSVLKAYQAIVEKYPGTLAAREADRLRSR